MVREYSFLWFLMVVAVTKLLHIFIGLFTLLKGKLSLYQFQWIWNGFRFIERLQISWFFRYNCTIIWRWCRYSISPSRRLMYFRIFNAFLLSAGIRPNFSVIIKLPLYRTAKLKFTYIWWIKVPRIILS